MIFAIFTVYLINLISESELNNKYLFILYKLNIIVLYNNNIIYSVSWVGK